MSLIKLSEVVIKQRKEKGWTQSEAAKYAGISLNTYRRIESGFIEEVGINKVTEVLALYGLEIAVRDQGRPLTLEELQSGQTY